MFDDAFNQQANGEELRLPPLGNADPRFSSAMSEMMGDLTQGQRAPVLVLSHPDLDHAGAASPPVAAYIPTPTTPIKAKDLELAGEVALFREIVDDWGIDDHRASALLGYNEPTFASELFKGLVSIQQRDAEERLQLVITIAIDLEALYRDRDVIRKWLRTPQKLLDGAVPLVMATNGTSLDLLKLSEYVEYLSGR